LAEIQRLHGELDRANASVDDKLDKLEDAGQGVVGLTRKLADARTRIVTLEDEVARLGRREERRQKRLEKTRCGKCSSKLDLQRIERALDADERCPHFPTTTNSPFDLLLPVLLSLLDISADDDGELPTRGKTSEELRAELRTVNSELQSMKVQWDAEKRKLLGEKAALQDTANKLNAQVRNSEAKVAKAEAAANKAKSGVEAELDKAKDAIAEFENELRAERSRLRALTTEKSKAEREKQNVLLQLQRTEDVRLSHFFANII
jgi:chromosome segregation ATPase